MKASVTSLLMKITEVVCSFGLFQRYANMNKMYGFEQEFFIKKDGKYVFDWVGTPLSKAEARSEPHRYHHNAIWLLHAAIDTLKKNAARNKLTLVNIAYTQLPLALTKTALREHGKGPRDYKNMYGKFYADKDTLSRAGLHIHFGTEDEYSYGKSSWKCPRLVDLPYIVRQFDIAFKDEIADAKRLPGEYALKLHGFEYRSLPATVDLDKVERVLGELRW